MTENHFKISTLFGLEGKNIVITGANGYLGRNVSSFLLSNGANVLALSRKKDKLEEMCKTHMESGSLVFNEVDCRDEEEVSNSVKKFVAKFGPVDSLFNNAFEAPRRPSLEMDVDEINKVFQSCFVQYWIVSRNVIPHMNPQGASIINNGSLWAKVSPKLSTYLDLENEPSIAITVSKAAVHQLSRYLSSILAEKLIRVNTLVPGFFAQKRGVERLDYLEEIYSNLAIKRIGKPDDLFAAVAFLVSSGSSYMTGQELIIDGGYLNY